MLIEMNKNGFQLGLIIKGNIRRILSYNECQCLFSRVCEGFAKKSDKNTMTAFVNYWWSSCSACIP